MEEKNIEIVADMVHRIWGEWMDYMFGKCEARPDGSMTIPAEYVLRWKRQMQARYYDLPEEEKKSDREVANKYIKLFHEMNYREIEI